MTHYKMHETYDFVYATIPMPVPRQHRPGSTVTITEDGNVVARVEVVETDEAGYRGKVINTFGHKRGPSEFKQREAA